MTDKVITYLKSKDTVLWEVAEKVEVAVLQPVSCGFYFPNLCRHIVYQQLSGKAAAAILKRFQELFPKNTITVDYLLNTDNQKLRETGVSKQKIFYLKDLAKKIKEKELVLEKLNELDDEDVILELTKVKGIGRWTAEMFLMNNLGREDVFSHGDLGLRNAIKRLYGLENPTREKIEKISSQWSPYRSYACKILWRSLEI